jgi:transcriptional regulator with XRE-family HTH domain
MSTTATRPAPIGEVRGRAYYDIAEVIAYRKARGVTQADLAATMHVSQPYISMIEKSGATRPQTIQPKTVEAMLRGIDFLAGKREKLIAEGTASMAEIRASRKPKASK